MRQQALLPQELGHSAWECDYQNLEFVYRHLPSVIFRFFIVPKELAAVRRIDDRPLAGWLPATVL